MFVFKTLQFCRTYVQSTKPLLSTHHLLFLVNSWRISTKKMQKKKNHSNYPMYIKIWVWQSKICIMSIAHIIFKVGVASLTVHSTGKD